VELDKLPAVLGFPELSIVETTHYLGCVEGHAE
jgi:hypothetical protein